MITLICLAVAVLLLLAVMLGCTQEPGVQEVVNVLGSADASSPTLVAVVSTSSSQIRLEFNEPVKVYGNSFEPLTARADGKFVYVDLNTSLRPGTKSDVCGRVKDYSGNTSGFTIQVWGYNPDLPQVLINEFTTKGTTRSPDRTELRMLSSGNISGMTLYNGVPSDFDAFVVFEDIDVRAGDMLVVWWTEEISVQEIPGDLNNWQEWGSHSGYFDSYEFYHRWCHTTNYGAGRWLPISEGNVLGFDASRIWSWPTPWSSGSLSWKIPYGWKRRDNPSNTCSGQISPPSYSVWTMCSNFLEKVKHSHRIGMSLSGATYLDGDLQEGN